MAGSDGGDDVSAPENVHVRHPDDFYATPAWVTRAVLPLLPAGPCVDPCAGDGAIVEEIAKSGRQAEGVELDPIRALKCSRVVQGDGLERLAGYPNDWHVVMNPPYKAAEEWVRAAVQPGRTVAALLRLGFLASSGRAGLFVAVGIPDVYVLSRRPSFTGNGKTDGTDYAWFVWGPGRGGRIQRLEVP